MCLPLPAASHGLLGVSRAERRYLRADACVWGPLDIGSKRSRAKGRLAQPVRADSLSFGSWAPCLAA